MDWDRDWDCPNILSNTSLVGIPTDCDNLILSLIVTLFLQSVFLGMLAILANCPHGDIVQITDFTSGFNFALLAVGSFALSGVS